MGHTKKSAETRRCILCNLYRPTSTIFCHHYFQIAIFGFFNRSFWDQLKQRLQLKITVLNTYNLMAWLKRFTSAMTVLRGYVYFISEIRNLCH